MTGECVSRCHELSRWCVTQCCRHVLWSRSGRHTTKNGPISTDNHSQLAPNCKHLSRVLKTSDHHLCSHFENLVGLLKKRMHRRLLWFMKIQWVTFGSQLGMEFLLLLSDLIINQLFDRGWIFITDGFYLSSSKMYFPAWGWVESIQVWLACLDLKPKLKLSFQYFDISTILQTGDRGL